MFSPHDADYNTLAGPGDRSARVANRREIINEKKLRHTDMLPKIKDDTSNGKTTYRQLREENKRLRWKLDEQQHLIYQYKHAQAQLEQEIDNLNHNKQTVIEQYEIHLREAIEELNQLQVENQELQKRYLELDRSFHENVSEEAEKLVAEAANTIILTPEHTPPLLHNVAKTVELHMKQSEDQHVAELLSLIRQAQYKSELLEQELAFERERNAQEHQNLIDQQNTISQQAQYRYTTIQQHLKARWTMVLALMTALLLVLVTILQFVFVALKAPLFIAIFTPILLCIGVAFLIAREYTNKKIQEASKKLDQKTSSKETKHLSPGAKQA